MSEPETQIPSGDWHQIAPDDATVTPQNSDDATSRLEGKSFGELAGYRQQRTVPYGALAEERARRKGLQRELQNAVESQQRLQGRLDLLHELAQQQGVDATNVDAEAVQEHVTDPQPASAPEESPGQDSNAQAGARFRTQLMHSVRDAIRERPDFLAAYQHARQARVAELCALGYAPQDALAIAFDNEAEIINNAYASGRNPAQIIYDYAQRHGYRGSNGPRRDPGEIAPSRGVAMSDAEKVALAARGQAASKSLSAAGGGATGALTLEALAGMSDDEFAEATRGDRWQKLLKS